MDVKKNTLCILILLTVSALVHSVTDKQRILILPFHNAGSLEYEHLCSQISMYNYSLIKETAGFEVIHPALVKSALHELGYNTRHLEDSGVLKKLTDHFDAVYVVGGTFTVKNDEFSAYMYIKREKAGVFSFVDSDIVRGNIDDLIIKTFDSLFLPILTTIIGENIQSAFLTIQTDLECSLFIDEEYFAETPLRLKIKTGEHRLEVVHADRLSGTIIYAGLIDVTPNEDRVIELNVFCPVTITAGRECGIFINNKTYGTTPFRGKLHSGNSYRLKIIYYNGNGVEVVVEDTIISTNNGDEVILDYPDSGILTILGKPPFWGSLDSGNHIPLPHSSASSKPGDYRIQAVLEDDKWRRNWIFYNELHTLKPFETLTIDLNTLSYKKLPGLCFIPGAAQFYNHERGKGFTVDALFYGFLLSAGISFFTTAAENYERQNMLDEYDQTGIGSGYTFTDIQAKADFIQTGWRITTGSLIAAGIVYLYSFIDGYVSMNHLDELVNEPVR